MRAATRSTLIALAAAFNAAGIAYQLGGSGLLYSLGLVDRVGDLDLVFEAASRPALRALLLEETGREPDFASDQEPDFVSAWRCTHQIGPQALDLTGGVAVSVAGRRVELPFTAGDSWALGDAAVDLAPIEQWWLIYRVHGKPDRAAALEGAAAPGSIDALLGSLGLERSDLP